LWNCYLLSFSNLLCWGNEVTDLGHWEGNMIYQREELFVQSVSFFLIILPVFLNLHALHLGQIQHLSGQFVMRYIMQSICSVFIVEFHKEKIDGLIFLLTSWSIIYFSPYLVRHKSRFKVRTQCFFKKINIWSPTYFYWIVLLF
jgi:hypothetical protein